MNPTNNQTENKTIPFAHNNCGFYQIYVSIPQKATNNPKGTVVDCRSHQISSTQNCFAQTFYHRG